MAMDMSSASVQHSLAPSAFVQKCGNTGDSVQNLPAIRYTLFVSCHFRNEIWGTNSDLIYWLQNYAAKNNFIFKSLGMF